jgi:hypothetical protein
MNVKACSQQQSFSNSESSLKSVPNKDEAEIGIDGTF